MPADLDRVITREAARNRLSYAQQLAAFARAGIAATIKQKI